MWGVMYAFLKYDILDMDTLIAFMNRYSFTSQYSQMVLNHPGSSGRYLLSCVGELSDSFILGHQSSVGVIVEYDL